MSIECKAISVHDRVGPNSNHCLLSFRYAENMSDFAVHYRDRVLHHLHWFDPADWTKFDRADYTSTATNNASVVPLSSGRN